MKVAELLDITGDSLIGNNGLIYVNIELYEHKLSGYISRKELNNLFGNNIVKNFSFLSSTVTLQWWKRPTYSSIFLKDFLICNNDFDFNDSTLKYRYMNSPCFNYAYYDYIEEYILYATIFKSDGDSVILAIGE